MNALHEHRCANVRRKKNEMERNGNGSNQPSYAIHKRWRTMLSPSLCTASAPTAANEDDRERLWWWCVPANVLRVMKLWMVQVPARPLTILLHVCFSTENVCGDAALWHCRVSLFGVDGRGNNTRERWAPCMNYVRSINVPYPKPKWHKALK